MDYYTIEDLNNLPAQMIPTSLFKNPNYPKEKLCNNAKWVYSFLFNRLFLSAKNNWVDDNGHVYVIFTRQQMMELLEVSEPTIAKCFAELVACGLLEEVSQGLGKAYILYPGKVKQADTQNSLVPEEEVQHTESGVPKNLGSSIKQIDSSTDKHQAAIQDASQSNLKDKDKRSTSLLGQRTLFEMPQQNVDTSKMSKKDKALYRVKFARQTGNWDAVTYQDLTYYFVHLHNQAMPDELIFDTTSGYQVQIFRDYFIRRLEIPLTQFHEHVVAFFEVYKSTSLILPKYARSVNFQFFRVETVVDRIWELVKVRLEIQEERRQQAKTKTAPTPVQNPDEIEVW